MNDYKWIEALKVGDKVIVEGRYYLNIRKIIKVNKCSVAVEGWQFRKTDGKLKGGNRCYRTQIKQATPDAIAKTRRIIQDKNTRNFFFNADFSEVPIDALIKAKQIIDDATWITEGGK